MSQSILKNIYLWLCLLYFVIAGIWISNEGKIETFLFFNRQQQIGLFYFYRYYTHIGDGLFVVFVMIILLFVKYYYSLMLLLCYGIPSLVVQYLKRIVYPEVSRPWKFFQWEHPLKINFPEGIPHPAIENSFPSGHTTSAFALFLVLSIIVQNQFLRTVFFFMALNCAISRVYTCEHFFVDTYAGAVISILLSVCIVLFMERSSLKKKLSGSLKLYNKMPSN